MQNDYKLRNVGPTGIEPALRVFQTRVLPLHRPSKAKRLDENPGDVARESGIEPNAKRRKSALRLAARPSPCAPSKTPWRVCQG